MKNEAILRVPLDLLNDKNITTKAKFLYCFMVSKPKDWNFTVRGLSGQLQESTVTVNKMLKELRELGWIDYGMTAYNKSSYKINKKVKKTKKLYVKHYSVEEISSYLEDYRIDKNPKGLFNVFLDLLNIDTSKWKMSKDDKGLIEEKILLSKLDSDTMAERIICNLERMDKGNLKYRFGNLFLGLQ